MGLKKLLGYLLPVTLWVLGVRETWGQIQPSEVELLNTLKETKLEWIPAKEKTWNLNSLPFELDTPHPVYQACSYDKRNTYKLLWTNWIARGDANHLLVDLGFAQEECDREEPACQLEVYLLESEEPLSRRQLSFYQASEPIQVNSTKHFHHDSSPQTKAESTNSVSALDLGPLSQAGFHLGFGYSGPCIFLSRVRVYFRKCPGFSEGRADFPGAAGGAGQIRGACVENSIEVSPPLRECGADGIWGDLEGQCVCDRGYQETGHHCEACRIGYYKPANRSEGCQQCPPNSKTEAEGGESCQCMMGYFRLDSDPVELGCTKPPSAPQNLTFSLHQSSVTLSWDPPGDLGGRGDVQYAVGCWERAGSKDWEHCGDTVHYPRTSRLTNTTVTVTGLQGALQYRFHVEASNAVSATSGAARATSAVSITKWEPQPPLITTLPVSEKLSSVQHYVVPGAALGVAVLIALIVIVLIATRNKYKKLAREQEVELLPVNSGRTYKRQTEEVTSVSEGVTWQLLEVSEQLKSSLKDVLVERSELSLGRDLGSGEFGAVYEGYFRPTDGPEIKVAVKTMRVGLYSQEDLESFLKEAEIMQNFNHTNVVRLLGVALESNPESRIPSPMVILPFMKHGDLRRFLLATRHGEIPMFVPSQTLLRFMIHISSGMQYLSSRGFLHRDLAARNCMLGDDLRVCVADFGLSKKIYSSNYYRQKVAIRMPVKWMAIESMAESVYTSKSDVWSFGVTMWEIVSRGRSPYPGVQNHEMFEFLEAGNRLKQPADCDPKLYQLMTECWSPDPSDRPSFSELEGSLKELLASLPPLHAKEEAQYINQGLELAVQGLGGDEDKAQGNLYLPNPTTAPLEDSTASCSSQDEEGYQVFSKFQ
ncbi:ephrin type-B receptor 1-like [Huso huso]|uniref:receptor protein-tyrosine kinase n=1 Tax=Huso huso TaxID=61971 RepID=A0ABR0YZ44_HUSHU